MQQADQYKVGEITQYMNQNPSFRLSIDGSMDRAARTRAARISPIVASTPYARRSIQGQACRRNRIQTGTFGDEGRRRDRRVEVLISSGN
jgi:hypothetical protein